jgi:hypothetical protein
MGEQRIMPNRMTLFGLVYICRLYGNDPAYDKLRADLGQSPDLASAEQQDSLLLFLNKWKCRIKKESFPCLKKKLQTWAFEWVKELPGTDIDIRSLAGDERRREQVAKAYDDACSKIGDRFRDTATAKTLHVIRPQALPAWDGPINSWFLEKGLHDSAGETYAAFICHVASEISTLEADANRLGYSLSGIPQLVGRPDYSLVKLVDQFYWMTITGGYTVPTRADLEQWLCLCAFPRA